MHGMESFVTQSQLFCRQRRTKKVFIYFSKIAGGPLRQKALMFGGRSKERALVSNVQSSNSGGQEKE
jgi:hypothetical protein